MPTALAPRSARAAPLHVAPGQSWPRTPAPQSLWAHIASLQATVRRQEEMISLLEAQSTTDELTELLNRRGLEERLEVALENAKRYHETASVIMVDLNRFKTINDTLGHAAGDAMLRHVAALLRQHTRKGDTVARLGGDEFVILLHTATPAVATAKIKALEALVETTPLMWQPHWREAEKPLTVGLSYGIAGLEEATTAPEILHLADTRMYSMKKGR